MADTTGNEAAHILYVCHRRVLTSTLTGPTLSTALAGQSAVADPATGLVHLATAAGTTLPWAAPCSPTPPGERPPCRRASIATRLGWRESVGAGKSLNGFSNLQGLFSPGHPAKATYRQAQTTYRHSETTERASETTERASETVERPLKP
jgi:hypothetical protein